MFEYWTPLGHFFALGISLLYAGYVSNGKLLSKRGIFSFAGSAALCYFAMGLWG